MIVTMRGDDVAADLLAMAARHGFKAEGADYAYALGIAAQMLASLINGTTTPEQVRERLKQ